MKKKIYKYIKVMMACLLITSLTLPSYAAVSASDGSAFVTKAEFDAALSDFNARLTTFEAGINSKIDSQVSSYLDRNGIWNGKDQTLLFNERVWLQGVNTGQFVDGKAGQKIIVTRREFNFTGTPIAGNEYMLVTEVYELINKMTKSGLLYLGYNIQTAPNVLKASYYANDDNKRGWTVTAGNDHAQNYAIGWDFGINFYQAESLTIAKTMVPKDALGKISYGRLEALMEVNSGSTSGWGLQEKQCFNPIVGSGALQFFVSKGQNLYMNYRNAATPNSGGAVWVLKGLSFASNGNSYSGWYLGFQTCKIY